ncbi:hypothetical protein DY000_02006540 [Brassica cretica]|uniref:Uncharacterized protein n=1 Tax=Brassica cretica TaxID=69181 RepID=A0ABQ7C699_BRACR|nr:hypothetical protein DY000_02006540 [Brassica cretica]
MAMRGGRRPDSTLKGMNSLEGGCSVESGFMESVGSDLMALNHGLGRFRNDAHCLSRAVHGQDPYDPASWTTSLLSWVSWESGQLSWMDCWKLGPMCQFWAVTWPIGWSMMAMGRWALGIGPGAWATSLGLSVTCLGAVSPVRDVWREGRRPNSTLNGMNSLEGGCSVETGFMEIPWMGNLIALNHGFGRFRNDAHGLSRAVHGQDPYDPGMLVINLGVGKLCSKHWLRAIKKSIAKYLVVWTIRCTGCQRKTDRLHWDMVPWPVGSWTQYMAAGHSSVLAEFECDSSISWSMSSFS